MFDMYLLLAFTAGPVEYKLWDFLQNLALPTLRIIGAHAISGICQIGLTILLQLDLFGECFFSHDPPHLVDIRQRVKILIVVIVKRTL